MKFTGRLDGNSGLLNSLVPHLGAGPAFFDVGGIRRINSPGVAEWIRFLSALELKSIPFDIERCSVAFVQQMNMVSIFAGKRPVRSFFAPYYCRTCDQPVLKLIDMSGDLGAQIAEPPACPTCSNPAEFDDLVDAYLAFARR